MRHIIHPPAGPDSSLSCTTVVTNVLAAAILNHMPVKLPLAHTNTYRYLPSNASHAALTPQTSMHIYNFSIIIYLGIGNNSVASGTEDDDRVGS